MMLLADSDDLDQTVRMHNFYQYGNTEVFGKKYLWPFTVKLNGAWL